MPLETITDIFARTLAGEYDDDLPWNAVRALQEIGSREVFERAAQWCGSDSPLKRARGADVLAQLGNTSKNPGNKFPEESFSTISALMEQERDTLPLLAALHALGHIGNPAAVPLLAQHCLHPSADVRLAVAIALGQFANHQNAVRTLIELMQDVNDGVRDWATFGVGLLGDSDSSEALDALCQRMTDTNSDVRAEALAGLAKRKESRALPLLIAELSQTEVSDTLKDAAESFLDMDERPDWNPGDYINALQSRFRLTQP